MGILLYSHAALQSRLAENTFAKGDQIDLSGPVIRLENLSAEDFYALLGNTLPAAASEKRYTISCTPAMNAVALPDIIAATIFAFTVSWARHRLCRVGRAYLC